MPFLISAKTQAVVTAEDDGQILRCDVIVDRIVQLRIVTKTLELFLEEAPEQFFVRAYDEQGIELVISSLKTRNMVSHIFFFLGNEFSTLEGLEFIWSVESSSGKGENVKLFKFRDSKLIDSFEPDLIALEAKGLQGSKVLLEGKQNTINMLCDPFTYSELMLQTFFRHSNWLVQSICTTCLKKLL